MELGNAWVIIGLKGSNVLKKAITPAEAQILVASFKNAAGKFPLEDLEITGTAQSVGSVNAEGKVAFKPRTDAEEKARLKRLYDVKFVEKMFPGANAKMPVTFADAFPTITEPTAEVEAVGACVDTPGEMPKDGPSKHLVPQGKVPPATPKANIIKMGEALSMNTEATE